jgi:predicted nuclease of restriction endonuclease-like (RecB) superfamily
MKKRQIKVGKSSSHLSAYDNILSGMVDLLEQARRASARAVNSIMTATYWEIGRRIVEHEQKGRSRAGYGEELLLRLSDDLTARFGRGFSRQNLQRFREFYLAFPTDVICPTLSGISSETMFQTLPERFQTMSAKFSLKDIANRFPLPWSHYVLLLSVKNPEASVFYETEALSGGWSVRQLARQINSQFYERTALSRNKAAMLTKGALPKSEDAVTPEEELKDPLVLEFLGLKDEYSESELEEALIRHLEAFLLELGGDFCFVARQRRLRIDDDWFRVDLVFYHRGLRCLVLIDLKLGKFTHADAGQMHLYLNYAREQWTKTGENPPVGLVLCASKGAALAKYAVEGLPNKMLVREYLTVLPRADLLEAEIEKTRRQLERNGILQGKLS